jgi:4-amino-4-deoxy-L-arabinose transferase-like glycosyltransferase
MEKIPFFLSWVSSFNSKSRVSTKKILAIFVIALVVRIGYALIFVDATYLIHEDQSLYIQLGQTIAKTGEFIQPTINGSYTVVTERVPGYPAFLSVIYSFFGENNMAVVAAQILIDSFNCVIIGLIVESAIVRGFFIAGLTSALNLNMVILSGMILTDTLFLFLFSLFILFLFKYFKHKTKLLLTLAVSFLCLSTLVRPVSYYLIIFLLPLLIGWMAWKRIPLKQILYSFLIYLILIVVAFGSIHHRNYYKYDSFSLVSQGGSHALNWIVPATFQYSGQGSYQDGQIWVKNYLKDSMNKDGFKKIPDNPFKSSDYQLKVAKEALNEFGLTNVLHAWTAGVIINLMSPSAAFSPSVRAMKHPSFYATPGSGAVEKLVNYITNSEGLLYLSIIFGGSLISFIFVVITLNGFYKMIRAMRLDRQDSTIIVFSVFLILYFLVITGPVIGVKYRLPIEPIMTLFFSYSLINFRKYKIK